MAGVEAVGQLGRVGESLGERKCAFFLQPVRQSLAFEKLHDEKRHILLFTDVEKRADVRVVEG